MKQRASLNNIVTFPQGGSRVSPQLEDGYIRIANELYDKLLAFDFSKREYKVLMAVMRKTYGYGKTEDDISPVQIADMCGLHPNHVRSTLAALASRRVIGARKGRYGVIVGINKHYDQWAETTKLVAQKSNQNSCSKQPKQLLKTTKTVAQSNQNGTQQKTTPKDNSKRQTQTACEHRFDEFWAAYPTKVAKGQARKTFGKINPDDGLMRVILDALERQKAYRAAQEARGEFVPRWKHPSTWLNGECWDDETPDPHRPARRRGVVV